MRKKFNKPDFEQLLELGCELGEVASFFGTNKSAVSAWCKSAYHMNFTELKIRHYDCGNISLRRAQMKKALDGDTKMLIFLGKNRLGQSEAVTNKSADENSAINILAAQIMEAKKQKESENKNGNT